MFTQLINFTYQRLAFNRLLRTLAVCLAFASGVNLLLLLADRWFNFNLSATPYLLLFIAALAAFILLTWLSLPTRRQAALAIDRTLRLHDQFSSAQALASPASQPFHRDPDFADLLTQQADALAARINVRTIAPLQLTRHWLPALVLLSLFILAFIFLPARARPLTAADNPLADSTNPALAQRNQTVADELKKLVTPPPASQPAGLASNPDSGQALDPADVRMLEQLASQLSATKTNTATESTNTNDSTNPLETASPSKDPAAALNTLAQKLQDQSEINNAASESLAQQFSTLDTPTAPPSTHKFLESLKQGDLNTAASAIKQLIDQSRNLPADKRKKLARDLNALADELRARSQSAAAQSREQDEQLRQTLRDLDLPTDDLLDRNNTTSPSESREKLERQLHDSPDAARQLAEDLARHTRDQKLNDQTTRDLNDLADSLDRSADDLTDPAQPPPSTQPAPQPPPATASARYTSDHSPSTAPENSSPPTPPTTTQPSEPPPTSSQSQPIAETQPPSQPQPHQPKQSSSEQQQKNSEHPQQSNNESNQQQPGSKSTNPSTSQSESSPQSQPSSRTESSSSESSDPHSASQPQQTSAQSQPAKDQPSASPQSQPASQKTTTESQPSKSPRESSSPAQQQPANNSSRPTQSAQSQPGQRAQPSESSQQQSPTNASSQPDPSQQRTATQPDSTSSPTQDPSAEQNPSAQKQSLPNNRQNPTPDADPASQPSAADQPAPTATPQPTPQSPDQLLRELAQRNDRSHEQQNTSEKLRDLARKLSDNMSPEEKRKWAEHWQKENPSQNTPPQLPSLPQPQTDQPPSNSPENSDRTHSPHDPQQSAHPQQTNPPDASSTPNTPDDSANQNSSDAPRQPNQLNRTQRNTSRPPANLTQQNLPHASDSTSPNGNPHGNPSTQTRRTTPPSNEDVKETETDPLDLRGNESPDSTIFRWLDDQAPNPDAPPASTSAPITVDQARHAVETAEQAVNQSSAPPRYHSLIKRFFGRISRSLPTTSDTSSSRQSSPAPPASQP